MEDNFYRAPWRGCFEDIVDCDGKTIATVRENPRAESNGILMLAAPDMLRALIIARNRLDSGTKSERDFNSGVVAMIDCVINKSRGE